jgi:hypothetical protein
MADIKRMVTFLPLVCRAGSVDDGGMFKAHCPRHGSDVLLFADNIESVRNRASDIEVRWVCSCGHRGRTVTGRRREPRRPTGVVR